MADDFDFGFTAVDDIPAGERVEQPVQAEIPTDQIDKIMDKLEQLESRILASDNSTWNECYHAFKYLFNSDVDSYQRFFLKMDTNLSGFSPCNNIVTAVNNYELFFFYPDGSGLIGFKLNGYDGGIEGQTNIRLFFNND